MDFTLMQPDETAYMTIKDAAAKVGVNRSTLWRQVRSGAVRSHNGKVVLAEVIADRAANLNLVKARGGVKPSVARRATRTRPGRATKAAHAAPAGQSAILSFSAAQARRESAVADIRQLEYAQKAGRLIDRAEHDRVLFECGREFRDALRAWPIRVQTLMANELELDTSTGKIAADRLGEVLSDFVRNLLAELSGDG